MSTEKSKTPIDQANAKVQAAVEKRKRSVRPFPACPFEESLDFAREIYKYRSGQPVRRLGVFDYLQKSPDSGPSRTLITNSGKYGLTKGSYTAEQIELTPEGLKAVDEETTPRENAKSKIFLAIENIEPFKKLYDLFTGNKLPVRAALTDAIKKFDIPSDLAEEAVDTFIVNLRFTGLLQTLSGAERIITVNHYLDSLPSSDMNLSSKNSIGHYPNSTSVITQEHAEYQ